MFDTDVIFPLHRDGHEIAVTTNGIVFFRRDGKSSVFIGADLDALKEAVALADVKRAAWRLSERA